MAECQAVVNIKGAHYACEYTAPHSGVAHVNSEAGAIWCSHGEAKAARKKMAQP